MSGSEAAGATHPGHATEEVLQVWEGYVQAVSDDGFTMRLVDVMAGGTEADEEADLAWGKLPGGRPEGIREGTYLRWRILAGADGQGRSEFTFDIAGAWTAEELEQAKVRGAELAASLAASSGDSNRGSAAYSARSQRNSLTWRRAPSLRRRSEKRSRS